MPPNPEQLRRIARRAAELAEELQLEPSRAIGAALTEADILDIEERQNLFGPIARTKEFRARRKGPVRPHGIDAVEAEARAAHR